MELDEIKQVTKELAEAKATLVKQQEELKEAHKLAMKAVEDAKELSKTQGENIDKALTAANETGLQVKDLGQQLKDVMKAMKEGPSRPMTQRQRIAKAIDELTGSKELLEKMSKGSGSFRIKTVQTVDTSQIGGFTIVPYIDTMVSLTRQPLTIRQLLTVIPVSQSSIKYPTQTVRTNNAAVVAEGQSKPYSTYAWGTGQATVEVIAHLTKLTLQALSDAPQLAAEIEAEMRYGLALAEEAEILNGNGATGHMSGLWLNATEYLTPTGVDETLILNTVDRLRIALLQLQLAYAPPNGTVLNPVDIANIQLIRRDTDTGHGGYIFGNPDNPNAVVTLWGTPVVPSPAMGVGHFLAGAFDIAANLYQREGVEVAISTENQDDFEKNQATMRVELREGLGVRRAWAMVKGSLGEGS